MIIVAIQCQVSLYIMFWNKSKLALQNDRSRDVRNVYSS